MNQFERHRGQCGVCGDPWQGPRDHEAGGKYARGLVAKQYKTGAFINVTVELTSNHKGYFEFRLCPVNDPHKKATQPCLDQNLLNIVGHGTRYFITQGGANVFIELIVMLPPRLKCSQCVLQWKWVAGQSMGPDGYGGECLGCGNQEHFVNCADIAIGSKPVTPLPLLPEAATEPPPPAGADHHGPSYHVHNAPASPHTNNYEVNMASLVKQIYNSIATGVQTLQTSTPAWTGTSFSQATPQAPQWNSAPEPQNNMWQQNAAMPNVQSMLGDTFGWAGGAAGVDFPGYEHGEYPEISELHAHTPGASSTYLKGYSDALSQMSETFGFPGMGVKASPAFNEVSLSLQEAQKGPIGTSFSTPMLTAPKSMCADGSEMECRASNPMFSLEFDSFCQNSCSLGQCQGSTMCSCSCPGSQSWASAAQALGAGAGSNCRAVDRTKASSMDKWCVLNCKQNNCPSNLCVCG